MDRKQADAAARALLEPAQQARRRRRSRINAELARAERLRRRSRMSAALGVAGAATGALVASISGDNMLRAMLTGGLIGVIAGMAVGAFLASFAQLRRGDHDAIGQRDNRPDDASGGPT